MRRALARWMCGVVLALASAALGAAALAQGRDLTVVSRGGAYQEAQREAFFRPWMQARQQRMLEESWDGGIEALRARVRAGLDNWDIVQVEGDELLIGCAEGLFERLDWAALGGPDRYVPDAAQECGVGAIVSSLVLAWDRAAGGRAPTGWADLFDTARFPGPRGLRRGPKGTLEIALLGDGVPPAEVYRLLATEAGTDRALRRLEAIRGELRWWDRAAEPAQWLAAAEVVLTSALNGRIAAANSEDGRDFGMLWQQHLPAMEYWAVMRGSPNLARAMDFLVFVGDPRIQAALPPLIPYGVTARGAAELLPSPLLGQLPTAARHGRDALPIDPAFWQAHHARLSRRLADWLNR